MSLPVALYQMDATAGDLTGNRAKIIAAARNAQNLGAKVLITPEMSLIGYPAEDWILRPDFQQQATAAIHSLAQELVHAGVEIPVIVGCLQISDCKRPFNAAYILQKGDIQATYQKHHLPEYGVFDEDRVFTPGKNLCVINVSGYSVGIAICEDLWYPDIAIAYSQAGAKGLLILNASPYEYNKASTREEMVARHLKDAGLPGIYVNLVGGQDELVFDGGSFITDKSGSIRHRMGSFVEKLAIWDLFSSEAAPVSDTSSRKIATELPKSFTEIDKSREASMYSAITLAIADYVHKNGFRDVVLGLSGGVDSALVASLAADALGPEHVTAIMMPTRFTADESVALAKKQAATLGIRYFVRPIESIFSSYQALLKEDFEGLPWTVAEENLQARIRGTLLMAWSNKFGSLVLTTGNKSETAIGYSTLYGDTAGAFAPIKDIYKTTVWSLCRWRNQVTQKERILHSIIDRAPSAELRENQKDQDSLPSYETLDGILQSIIEESSSLEDIVKNGYKESTVKHILTLLHKNEYKRRQSPIGPKMSCMSFGRDWRYPITWK